MKLVWLLVLVILNAGCESRPPIDGSDQHVDDEFPIPDTGPPAFETGQGPIVGIDEAHYNFHTAEGRYRPFAELLRKVLEITVKVRVHVEDLGHPVGEVLLFRVAR